MIRFLLLTTVSNCLNTKFSTAAISMALRSVDFEVYGRVQGVFFRKCTKQQAEKLDLKGWCRNTSRGTVEGCVQGPSEKVAEMMDWLKNTGSPSSKIEKADFRNGKDISEYNYSSFKIQSDN